MALEIKDMAFLLPYNSIGVRPGGRGLNPLLESVKSYLDILVASKVGLVRLA
jgi:hypothetical protein